MTTLNAVGTTLSGASGTGAFAGNVSPTFITPALGTPSSGDLSNCTGVASPTDINLTTASYSTGTIAQSGTVITGIGTTFTSDMAGGLITYPSGDTTLVQGFVDATHLNATDTLTESNGTYTLAYNGITAIKSGFMSVTDALIIPNQINAPDNLGDSTIGIFGSNSTIDGVNGGSISITAGSVVGDATSGSIFISAGDQSGSGNTGGDTYVYGRKLTLGSIYAGITMNENGLVNIFNGNSNDISFVSDRNIILQAASTSGIVNIGNNSGVSDDTVISSQNLHIQNLTAGGDRVLYIDSSTHQVYENPIPSSGISWNNVSGTTQAIAVNNGYISNNASLVTLTLPVTSALGSQIAVAGNGAGGWLIAQNAGQNIIVSPTSSTVGVGGSLASTSIYDSVVLVCVVADTTWVSLGAPQSTGLAII